MAVSRAAITNVLASAIAITVIGTGCNDSGETLPGATPPPLQTPQAISGQLEQKPGPSAALFIKNGVYFSYEQYLANPTPVDATAGEVPSTYSETTTQVEGIDELDRIEFDGTHFFVAQNITSLSDTDASQVVIYRREADNRLVNTATLPLSQPDSTLSGIYLHADEEAAILAAVTQQHQYFIQPLAVSAQVVSDTASYFSVDVFDVSDKRNVSQPTNIEVDGNLWASRRIDDAVYFVSDYIPPVPELSTDSSPAAQRARYNQILDMADTSFLPEVKVNGVAQRVLALDNCYLPANATEQDGYARIVQILKLDLSAPASLQATCVVGYVSSFHMGHEALYLTAGGTTDTTIHKFNLSDSPRYVATGQVAGIAGTHSAHSQLRMSERDGVFRILATLTEPQNTHHLYTLEQQGEELVVVGELPNSTYPTPIGKPGEQVYAVRYVKDKAYVVTFETIDPLYVLDLADPADPRMLGELEIPGYSSYLHPFGDDLLLGVGQQVEWQSPGSGGDAGDQLVPVSSLKVSLFDVRDPANPLEIDQYTAEYSYTPVEFDYRTLSVLEGSTHTLFGMPVVNWGTGASDSQLLVLNVAHGEQRPFMEVANTVIPTAATSHYRVWDNRSVLTDTGVYYLHGNELYYQSYGDSEQTLGPFH
ncbi:beta-propeller domain-containing protein [Alteromonas sp. ASW11-19]|uniref:Beta-propeller domain-containing protein n=1 Tax=Alteromonas salexigens TaxID=2982530 RepID=A0ABT2VR33_9ALTE|nr:beta-propeller domain-containing protein [Alteromonas salexigens]MCU7555353.1 beta-propeller domain-containing protein [Alteromonas salexigens]